MSGEADEKGPYQVTQATNLHRKGFAGLFSGLDLPNLIQLLAMNAFTGRAELRRGSNSGELFFKKGDVVHARFGEKQGTEAFEDIFTWPEGEIVLEPGLPPPKATIETPWHALLIHTMARLEDRKAGIEHPGQKMPSTTQQASGLLKMRAVHKSILDLAGVTSCIIGSRVPPVPLCPAQEVARIKEWFEILANIYSTFDSFRPPDSKGAPTSVWALVEGKGWLLVELEGSLVAVELERVSDIQDIEKHIRRLWQERG